MVTVSGAAKAGEAFSHLTAMTTQDLRRVLDDNLIPQRDCKTRTQLLQRVALAQTYFNGTLPLRSVRNITINGTQEWGWLADAVVDQSKRCY